MAQEEREQAVHAIPVGIQGERPERRFTPPSDGACVGRGGERQGARGARAGLCSGASQAAQADAERNYQLDTN